MSGAYKGGIDYIRSYTGVLKILEGTIHIILIIFTAISDPTLQTQFLCGISIYGFISATVLLAFHIRDIIKNSDFPWFWVECINCALMAVLLLISSTMVVTVLTKGRIITGIIGYIAVVTYGLDTIEQYSLARTPRSRYVWTTPNMPE